MALWRLLTVILICSFLLPGYGQPTKLTGTVRADSGPLEGVNVYLPGGSGVSTLVDGSYSLSFSDAYDGYVYFTYVGYDTVQHRVSISPGVHQIFDVLMVQSTTVLEQVEIRTASDVPPAAISIKPAALRDMPSAFGDFNRILATMPGVVTANELSSAYSVRGGNYDENLVYVNGMKVYRPFLVRAGRQEGLSFVNPSLAAKAEFYPGGWEARFDNALSSVLNVGYKTPTQLAGSITIGLLGGDAHIEGATNDQRLRYVAGIRHKRAEYLFNTFDVEGEYLPNFTDIQTYVQANLGKETPEKTRLGVLFSYAQNRYKVTPTTRETEFGTFNNAFRFLVAFEGSEKLDYDSWQTGIDFTRQINDKVEFVARVAGIKTYEREYSEVEGGYRLCDLDKNPTSSTFNECISIRGLGTNYFHARNTLDGTLLDAEALVNISSQSGLISAGLELDYQEFDDNIEEYRFVDSADYVTVTDRIATSGTTTARIFGGFAQHDWQINKRNTLVYGLRWSYRDLNGQFLVTPKIAWTYDPAWARNLSFKVATGLYPQYPLYREMRELDGTVNKQADAQQSWQLLVGADKGVTLWERPFHWTVEGYYKNLWDVIPYVVDNVRIRYVGDNVATAYAVGLATRFSGEFIKGAESWISLGILSTKEKLNTESTYVRRPTDQRVTAAIFFEDHLPGNPTMRVNLSYVFGSGLPFGPPASFESRTVFQGPVYNRVDVGFTKIFLIKKSWQKSIWLGLEILNLFGSVNTISYTWIQDVDDQYIAIPNNLSNRFFNMKLSYRFGQDY